MFKKLFFFFAVLVSCSFVSAKVFRNAYISFELPETWKCVLEHTEWVCRSEIDKESKEAIIILTAKEVGPTDSFESYVSHLNTPQSNSPKVGGIPSKIIYPPKRVQINDQTWVDGLHLGSEIPNYFTRYLATIKEKIAVLVTFSAHKNHYTKYSQDFFKAVQSLRVTATKNILASSEIQRPGGELIGPNISRNMPDGMMDAEMPPTGGSKGTGKTKSLLFVLALILAGGAFYVLVKMKKK